MGNQANGAQQQSLASAVFAYAANIGAPEALAPVIERIVHKHVSVGIRAEHYPIVGRHLLGARGDAYNALAALFIVRGAPAAPARHRQRPRAHAQPAGRHVP